ncbi:MAG: hypothetical protein ACQER9_00050 [Nanobdellota archaeon]
MKKAQGMSLNTIVIAALVVMILVVLSVIFLRSGGNVSETVGGCEVQGGKCAVECGQGVYNTEEHSIRRPDLDDSCSEGKVCCIKG